MVRFPVACIYVVTIAVATACVDRTGSAHEAAAPDNTVVPTTTASARHAELHELLPALVGAEAFPLASGSFLTGTLAVSAGNNVSALAVQVGNYGNTSDGSIAIDLCQDGNCARGQTALAGSTDNQYLEVPLDRSLEVVSNNPLTYRIVKIEGTNPVALWLYQPAGNLSSVKVNDQMELDRAPRIAARF